MMMSEAFLCCDYCFEKVALRNTKMAKFWIDLCAIYGKNKGNFGLILNDEFADTAIRTLETMGYLVSTDNDKGIVIHMNGEGLDENGFYFCPGDCVNADD
jgi:hypothetical protein